MKKLDLVELDLRLDASCVYFNFMSLILKLYSDVILITKVHDLVHILVEYK